MVQIIMTLKIFFKLIVISFALMLGFNFFKADFTHATSRKLNPAAHVHGAAEVTIAFDKEVGKLEFKIPSESILGFEHKAKSESELKIQNDKLNLFETKINEIIVFETNLGCVLSKNTIEIIYENETENLETQTETQKSKKHIHNHKHSAHSDFTASFNIKCKKSPLETMLVINFLPNFPKVKSIEATALIDQLQISKKSKSSKLDLKLIVN